MQDGDQIVQPIKELDLPKPHILARLVDANETYLMASRGSWKTSRGISLYTNARTYEMPRSTGVLVGLSFEHLGDNTLPPLLHAWDEFGFEHGVHYVVAQEPPRDWPKPYIGPVKNKYDHAISWHNGSWMSMVSLKKRASANGISAQWGVFDEVKFMKESQLVDEIFPIFRGNEQHFKHCSGYLSKFFATDKLADPVQIKWLLKKRELMNVAKIDLVINLQIHLNTLKQAYNGAGINKKQRLRPQIHALETRLAKLRSNLVFYVEASAYDVLPIMGEKWLKDKKRNSSDHVFKIAYENMDPDKPGESFYPTFDTNFHTHAIEYDINPTRPFIIAPDYQHSVAPIPVAQLCKLPGHDDVTLNYVDEIYTLDQPQDDPQPNGNGQEGGLTDAVNLFCKRFHRHAHKVVYYVYDHTAIGKRVDADAYFHLVEKELKKHGWVVRHVYTGMAPTHFTKFNNTREWLKDGKILINRERCKKMIISITSAPAKTTNGKTEKDKGSEKESALDQSETTHFSDAFDMINHAVFGLNLIKENHHRMGGHATR